MNIETFKKKLTCALNEPNTQSVITLLVRDNINNINKSELMDYLNSSIPSDKQIFIQLSNMTPWIAEIIWSSIDSTTTNDQKLSLFKNNVLFNEINRYNIEVLKSVMQIDVSLFVYEKEGKNILFTLLNEQVDLAFIKDAKEKINELSVIEKCEILRKINNTSYYMSDKQKPDIVEIITNIDTWYLDKQTYDGILRLSKDSNTKSVANKISTILSRCLDKKQFDYLNEKGINVIHDFMEYGFKINSKLIKKCIQYQPLNITNKKYILPLFVNNEEHMFNENIVKNFEEIKNYYGIHNVIGNSEQQKLLFNAILSPKSHLYGRYNTLFSGRGGDSLFIKMLQKIMNEKEISRDFKDIAHILCLASDSEFMSNGKINDVINHLQGLEFELTKKLIDSNIFNILLINMKDRNIIQNIEEQLIAINQKAMLKESISHISPSSKIQKRI